MEILHNNALGVQMNVSAPQELEKSRKTTIVAASDRVCGVRKHN
jgi:hypothetical protein